MLILICKVFKVLDLEDHRMLILNSVNPDMYQNNTASKTKTKLHLYIKENSIDQKLFAKMHRDKNNFNVFNNNKAKDNSF